MQFQEFDKEDFAKLTFPIHTLGKDDLVLEKFPRLQNIFTKPNITHDEKVTQLEIDKVIRYIIYAYDKGSPLIKKIDNLITRKVTAAAMAGFEHSDTFDPEVELMMKCRIEDVNNLIVKYCRLLKDQLYSLIVISSEAFHGTLQEIINHKTGGKKSLEDQDRKMKLIATAKKTGDEIDEWKREFLAQDSNQELADTLYTIVEEENLKLSPEENAEDYEEEDSE